jgi:hypothetical protein
MAPVCPYCGNTRKRRGFTEPVPVCKGMPAHIAVPTVRKCRACHATLSVSGFTPGTPAFARARAAAA